MNEPAPGSSKLPQFVLDALAAIISSSVCRDINFKNGPTAAYWHLVHTLEQHMEIKDDT